MTAKWWMGRGIRLVILLAVVTVVSFILVTLSPIDPVQAYVGADMLNVSAEQRELIAQRWGLNDPPVERFGRWLSQALQGNLGTSMIFNRPVGEVIRERFLASLPLMAISWVLSGVIAFTLGLISAARRGKLTDRFIKLWSYILASTPTFWIGLLSLMLFSVTLKWAPICCAVPPGTLTEDVTVWLRLKHLLLPALTLSVVGTAQIALQTRQKLIEVLESDYVTFARAQGESNAGIVLKHGVRNVIVTATTIQFASLAELFGGAVIAEQVFSYPGLGRATVESGLRGDVPLLLGIVIFSAIFVFVGNTIADLLQQTLDPRVRLGNTKEALS